MPALAHIWLLDLARMWGYRLGSFGLKIIGSWHYMEQLWPVSASQISVLKVILVC